MANSKNYLAPYHLITAGDMSLTSITSPVTTISYQDNVSIQLNFTGTPTGTFSIQGSLDQANWVGLSFSTPPVASGSADSILLDLNQLSFPFIRVVYTKGSGSGTLNAYISAKSV